MSKLYCWSEILCRGLPWEANDAIEGCSHAILGPSRLITSAIDRNRLAAARHPISRDPSLIGFWKAGLVGTADTFFLVANFGFVPSD